MKNALISPNYLFPKILIGSLVTLWSIVAGAQTLSLEGAIEESATYSPEIQSAAALHEEYSAKREGALSGFLPMLSTSAYHLTNVKYQQFSVSGLGPNDVTVPVVVPQTSLKFSASIPLFNGLRNITEYRASTAHEEAAESEAQWRTFTVQQEVKKAYYRALSAQLLAEVAGQNIKTLEDHAGHVEQRRKGGVATRYDLLRVEVQLDEAKTQKLLADDNVALERRRLARVMGLPDDSRTLEGKMPEPNDLQALDTLSIQNAANDRADLKARRLTEHASDLSRSAQHLWWVPAIGAFADYEIYNNTNFSLTESSYFHNGYDVGLALHWNLFDGGASIAKAREASARLKQSHAASEIESQKLPEALDTYRRRYRYGVSLYKTATSDIRKSEESVRQAQEGFKQGIRTVSEQLDAQLDLFRSRASQVNAELTAAEALINLELTVGRKLTNGSIN